MNEGVHQKTEEVVLSAPAQELKLSDKATFSELSKQYTFFTPALLMLYGNLPFDPIRAFYASKGIKSPPNVIITEDPIFEGLQTEEMGGLFNHFLMAIENELWKDLALHLGTMGTMDVKSRHYLGTEIQKLQMADYLALAKTTVLPSPVPMFDVYTVALDGNKVCLQFLPAKKPPIDRISVARSAPNRNVIEYAETIFNNYGKPS